MASSSPCAQAFHVMAGHLASLRRGDASCQRRLRPTSVSPMSTARHDWTPEEAAELLARPFHDLLAEAHAVHRERFDPHVVEAAILLSVKTGACPEDCA